MANRFVSPIPGGRLGRTDQGIDISASPGDPVVDPVPGISQLVGRIGSWYSGQPYEWFKVLTGPFRGRFWYAAEQIDFDVTHPGEQVSQGQRIGRYAKSGTATEWGWAAPGGQTLAASRGHVAKGSHYSPEGQDFSNRVHGAGSSPVGGPPVNWKPCILTWYDPALGGTNSFSGQSAPHGQTSSGEAYNPNGFTCAAPSHYKFGTKIMFRYRNKTVVCKVTDRGGAIVGNHFDLSRAAADNRGLGIINAGKVSADFAVVGRDTPTGEGVGVGVTRPGGAAPDTGAAVDKLFADYVGEYETGDARFAAFSGAPPGKTAFAGLFGLPDWLPGVPSIPQIGDDPLKIFEDPAKAIQGPVDALKLLAWILQPKSIVRMVEFLTGASLMVGGFIVALQVYRDAPGATAKRKRATGRIKSAAGEALKATPAGKAVTVKRAVMRGKSYERFRQAQRASESGFKRGREQQAGKRPEVKRPKPKPKAESTADMLRKASKDRRAPRVTRGGRRQERRGTRPRGPSFR